MRQLGVGGRGSAVLCGALETLCCAALWLAVQCVQEIWMRGGAQGYGGYRGAEALQEVQPNGTKHLDSAGPGSPCTELWAALF